MGAIMITNRYQVYIDKLLYLDKNIETIRHSGNDGNKNLYKELISFLEEFHPLPKGYKWKDRVTYDKIMGDFYLQDLHKSNFVLMGNICARGSFIPYVLRETEEIATGKTLRFGDLYKNTSDRYICSNLRENFQECLRAYFTKNDHIFSKGDVNKVLNIMRDNTIKNPLTEIEAFIYEKTSNEGIYEHCRYAFKLLMTAEAGGYRFERSIKDKFIESLKELKMRTKEIKHEKLEF